MKLPCFLIAFLCLAFVAMTLLGHASSTSSDVENNEHGSTDNPCKEIWENTTVSTPEGLVLCIVPSDEELTEQLKSIGGYNKHYVAVTPQEAIKFEPILPGWDGAETTKPTKPSSNRRCRRKRKRRHPIFGRKRYWKRSADSAKLGVWEDDEDGAELQGEAESKGSDDSASSEQDNTLQRNKRFAQEGIRESTKVGCVSKGESIGSLKQMCDRCQRRTELTADRFPPYINEVTCESKSGSPSDGTSLCSPQIGKCSQGYLLIDLLKRTDKYTEEAPPSSMYFKAYKQIWIPYTHKIRSCCECRLM